MSWFVVFASTMLPIALLFILLAMDWLQRGSGTTPSLLRIRNRKELSTGRKYLVSAGMLAFAMTAGQAQNALASGPQVTTPLRTEVAGAGAQKWNVLTVELAPGVLDVRHAYPGVELVYVLDGAGVLEVNGRAPVALNPGVVAAVQAKQPHMFKNTSQTQTLKVLIVLLAEQGHQRPLLANGTTSRHQKGLEQVANGGLGQQKADERNGSGRHELVF